MQNFGALIIGDEILSGKRQDGHFQHTVKILAQRRLELKWCRIIGDDPVLIIDTLGQTYACGDIVFSFGGIGATPDDHPVCARPKLPRCRLFATPMPWQK